MYSKSFFFMNNTCYSNTFFRLSDQKKRSVMVKKHFSDCLLEVRSQNFKYKKSPRHSSTYLGFEATFGNTIFMDLPRSQSMSTSCHPTFSALGCTKFMFDFFDGCRKQEGNSGKKNIRLTDVRQKLIEFHSLLH